MTHLIFFFFFFNDTATTEIYTLSLHDALPIYSVISSAPKFSRWRNFSVKARKAAPPRSEEHTSELQSRLHLVCRLLLEKKKKKRHRSATATPQRGRDRLDLIIMCQRFRHVQLS